MTLPLNSLFTEGLEKTSKESVMAHIIDYPTFYLEAEGIHDKSVSHNKCLQWYSHLSYADVLSTKSNRIRNKQNLWPLASHQMESEKFLHYQESCISVLKSHAIAF